MHWIREIAVNHRASIEWVMMFTSATKKTCREKLYTSTIDRKKNWSEKNTKVWIKRKRMRGWSDCWWKTKTKWRNVADSVWDYSCWLFESAEIFFIGRKYRRRSWDICPRLSGDLNTGCFNKAKEEKKTNRLRFFRNGWSNTALFRWEKTSKGEKKKYFSMHLSPLSHPLRNRYRSPGVYLGKYFAPR